MLLFTYAVADVDRKNLRVQAFARPICPPNPDTDADDILAQAKCLVSSLLNNYIT